jgi:hypothetical protein
VRIAGWFFALSTVLGVYCAEAYQLRNDVIDDGGRKMVSSGYVLRGSFGQSTVGKISGANYTAYIGFWHPYPSGPGVEERLSRRLAVPKVFSLSQNYPNPVAKATIIKYTLPIGANVVLSVYNSAGQKTQTLVCTDQAPGYYEVIWDLTGIPGERLSNGVYFCRMSAADFLQTRKMMILR